MNDVTRRRARLLVPLLALAGCGSSLDASSSCQDFMNASGAAQDEAVSKLAAELNAPSAVTPLGRPNVNYICANQPDRTLGSAVDASG